MRIQTFPDAWKPAYTAGSHISTAMTTAGPYQGSNLTLTASDSVTPATSLATITGTSGNLSHSVTTSVTVTAVTTGTIPVDLSSAFNVTGIYDDGSKFAPAASLDGDGYACSEQLLGSAQVGASVMFKLGPANAPDVVTGKTVVLPAGKFRSLRMLATGVNGSQELQPFVVTLCRRHDLVV